MTAAELFGRKLAAARAFEGITQKDLAKKVGLDRVTVARMEHGGQLRLLRKLELLADVLDRPLSWFFEEERTRSSEEVPA